MENKIYKKFNSLELLKKTLYIIFNRKLYNIIKICYQRYQRISSLLVNNFLFINNGNNFIKLKIFFFFLGYNLGNFCLTKKPNKHLSFKKLKTQKR